MNSHQSALARKQLDRRLSPLRQLDLSAPGKGWIKAIRESLGMTARQLAARIGAVPSRVRAIEQAEVTGATTIKTLRHVAQALNCQFVYAFVPTAPLESLLLARAKHKVGADLARLNHTMRLENQALLATDLKAEEDRMLELILSGSQRGLWDDDEQKAP